MYMKSRCRCFRMIYTCTWLHVAVNGFGHQQAANNNSRSKPTTVFAPPPRGNKPLINPARFQPLQQSAPPVGGQQQHDSARPLYKKSEWFGSKSFFCRL